MKVLLLGDLCPTKITNPLFEKCDTKKLFTDTLPIFKGNDINFFNLECALTESENRIKKFGPNLSATRNTAKVLKEIGINCVGLSNNHIFDFGIQGVRDTIESLKDAGIFYTGFGDNYQASRKNLIFEKDNEKICIIAVCEREYSYALEDRMGSRPFDEFDTIEDIRKAKAENNRVIVLYHGGKEMCQYPSPRLVNTCRAMAKSGADIIICQHSHCIGCYEEFNGCHILYGQGNFHFVERTTRVSELWDYLLAVKYESITNSIEFIPIVNHEYGITLVKGEEKENVLNKFEERNSSLKNGEWKLHWHEFCQSVKNNYITVIKNACTENSTEQENAAIGHYLDCQAHTDVLRELFPTYNQTNEK